MSLAGPELPLAGFRFGEMADSEGGKAVIREMLKS
jgi:hypothetical protein